MKKISSWWVAASFCIALAGHSAGLVKVSGTVDGFGDTTNNLVDGALVLPSLSPDDLFQFQIDSFMGPSEKMTIGGLFSAQVPSNFYFPDQTQYWGFLPVSFSKDSFDIYVNKGETRELVAAWFQLPFDKMIDIHQNNLPNTDMLPYINVKKYGYQEAQDISAESNISVSLDRDFGPVVDYTWTRPAITGTDMDAIFVFQETKTNNWAFANLVGNPSVKGEIATMSGLLDNFKVLFLLTHNDSSNKVSSAEGYLRGTTFESGGVSATGEPPALVAALPSASQVTWTPIDQPGWISLVVSKKQSSTTQTPFGLGKLFSRRSSTVGDGDAQYWIDPKVGTAPTNLTVDTIKNYDVILAFIGTSKDMPAPQQGGDNTAFLNAATEIRMKELQ